MNKFRIAASSSPASSRLSEARYVSTVFADPSGKVVPVSGSAKLLIRFFAAGVRPLLHQRSYALPGLLQVVKAGSFESVLTYGAGVARKEPIHLFTLTNPARVVIDIPTPYRTTTAGLTFVSSGATGFKNLTISDHVARVWLTGGCASRGSTLTVATEIIPTLKQFASVSWVKIFDPAGHTERPAGHSDSIPTCLKP